MLIIGSLGSIKREKRGLRWELRLRGLVWTWKGFLGKGFQKEGIGLKKGFLNFKEGKAF